MSRLTSSFLLMWWLEKKEWVDTCVCLCVSDVYADYISAACRRPQGKEISGILNTLWLSYRLNLTLS